MSCRRAPQLRRCWAEFPLVCAEDGRADLPDRRPFMGRPDTYDQEEAMSLFDQSFTSSTNTSERRT